MNQKLVSHEVIRESIVNDILRGKYEVGQMIPKQLELAEMFGVSRGTVRKAIDELVQKGVLITVKGRGTFVLANRSERRATQRPLSFSKAKRVKPGTLTSKVISIQEIMAEPWMAKQLCIPMGSTVILIKRVRFVRGNPENYQISYLARQRMGNIDFAGADLVNGSLYELIWEHTGLLVTEKHEEIRAVRCPKPVAVELNIHKDDPVLLILRTSYSDDGLPLEYCEDYECTDIKGLRILTKYAPSELTHEDPEE